jgi:hypothetical protein
MTTAVYSSSDAAKARFDTTYTHSWIKRSYILTIIPNFNELGINQVTIGFKLSGIEERLFHTFGIKENLQTNIVLGLDFIIQHQCTLNLENQTVTVRGQIYPLTFVPSEL